MDYNTTTRALKLIEESLNIIHFEIGEEEEEFPELQEYHSSTKPSSKARHFAGTSFSGKNNSSSLNQQYIEEGYESHEGDVDHVIPYYYGNKNNTIKIPVKKRFNEDSPNFRPDSNGIEGTSSEIMTEDDDLKEIFVNQDYDNKPFRVRKIKKNIVKPPLQPKLQKPEYHTVENTSKPNSQDSGSFSQLFSKNNIEEV
ncbi:unnamed protein product [Moneuplotes crassus]|uniref:Uncharacterized protein n=1 Tax=Euplotes crassus TaxID=5936 RepID=A0AAD1XIP5_EUPCR|nr:unnamed protein product [Moneuplotes crassus]